MLDPTNSGAVGIVQDSSAVGFPESDTVPEWGVVTVRIASLLPGESPRLQGLDHAHIAVLSQLDSPLPPILVDRCTRRVIDGMHRLEAAKRRGLETIEVEYFDGSQAEAFLRAVRANVSHGFPLSPADRRAAAARIIASHPHLSDRVIAEAAGLGAKAVATIRRCSTDATTQSNSRVGRDGRVRPLSSVEGRRKAAEVMTERPGASLREVARVAGISLATASDVRKRLERGEEPVPTRAAASEGAAYSRSAQLARRKARRAIREAHTNPTVVLEKLLRDPSLRLNDGGRRLLRLLRHNAIGAEDWAELSAAVPAHCEVLVGQLAVQFAQMWVEFARELDDRADS